MAAEINNGTPLQQILACIASGETPSAELVDALADESPAFTLPAMLRLRRESRLGDDERRRLTLRVALNAPDPAELYNLVGRDNADSPFYPPENPAPTPSTIDTIDTFLETYGHADAENDALLERMILNPQPEYATVLEKEYADAPDIDTPDEQSRLIDAFLDRQPVPEPEPEPAIETVETASETPAEEKAQKAAIHPREESSLNETLAKVYIRQGKYEQAYEILSRLNLNIPEKSVYFADQMRFLQKLIINSKHKSNTK